MSEEREVFKHPVEVALTDEEINARLNRNAEIDRKILEIQAEKAAANSGFNDDLKTLRKEQITLLESAKAGKATVEIDCYQERDDRRGNMLTLRCSDGSIVDERALTAEERNLVDDRQGNLFEGNAAAPPSDLDDEPEERGDEDTEKALAEYAAQNAAAGESNTSTAGESGDDSDDDDESDLGDPDDDSEGAAAH